MNEQSGKMRREDLERYLDRGMELGFIKLTNSSDYLGWILVSKEKPNERIFELFVPGEDEAGDDLRAQQELIRDAPYRIRMIELKREAYESDRDETNEDYRINALYRFATLDALEVFVRGLGYSLEQIKWRSEIGNP